MMNNIQKAILFAPIAGLALLAGAAWWRVSESPPPESLEGALPEPLTRPDQAGVSVPARETGLPIESTGARWYFNWTHTPDPGIDLEFVPLVCGYPGNRPFGEERLAEVRGYITSHAGQYTDGTLWVVGNEIGYRPQHDGRTPEQYARDFQACHAMLKAINPTWQVSVGPAVLSDAAVVRRDHVGGEGGLEYLRRMLVAHERIYGDPIPADWFAATAHVLGGEASQIGLLLRPGRQWDPEFAMDEFREQVVRLRRLLADAGFRDRPVVVTELGVGIGEPEPARIAEFMEESTRFLDTATDETIGLPQDGGRLVQRWAWFAAHPVPTTEKLRRLGFGALVINLSQTSLMYRDGRLTHLGRTYAALTGVTPGRR